MVKDCDRCGTSLLGLSSSHLNERSGERETLCLSCLREVQSEQESEGDDEDAETSYAEWEPGT